MEQLQDQQTAKEEKKVHAENMRLKKYIYELESKIEELDAELKAIKSFIGGVKYE